MTRILSFVRGFSGSAVRAALAGVAAFLVCSASFGAANLRFGFLTDTHINASATNLERMRGAFTLFKTNDVDLVVHGGDFANAHYPAAYTAISNLFDEVFGAAKPRFIGVVGNHDTQMELGSLSQLEATVETLALAGVENAHTDVRTVNGYTFLTMPYAIGGTDLGFLSWADYEAAVSNACEQAGAGQPVFLLEHEPPQDTIYNSHDWGYAKSKEILARYPQVVELSGHVHGSLRCDRCLWQGDFTVLNAGCLATWQGLLNGVAASDNKSVYEALVVEVSDDRIVARRYDVLTGEEIDPDRRWTIPLPFDAATAPYNLERCTANEVAPQFLEGAALTAKPGSTCSSFSLAFPEVATNTMTYWITVSNLNGSAGQAVVEKEVFSEFWKQTAAKTGRASVTVSSDAFEPCAEYLFCVQPVGQYGAKGAALTAAAVAAKAGDTPDGFVEYVRSTGVQYFDTGIIGRSGTKMEIDVTLDEVGQDTAILDCRKDENVNRFFLFHTSGSFAAYGYGDYKRQDSFKLVANRRYHVATELKAGLQTLDIDGRRVAKGTDSQTIDTGANLYLFACNFVSRGNPALYPIKARVYSLKMWQTDSSGDYRLVRDFVPCMAAAGVDKDGSNRRTRAAALYDRVTGRIFFAHAKSDRSLAVAGLETSGVLPDVWNTTSPGRPDYFVEYIRSTGSQVLDTGIPARAGLRAEGDVCYTSGLGYSDEVFLGVSANNYCTIVDRVGGDRLAWGGFGTYGDTPRYFTNETTGAEAVWNTGEKYHFTAAWNKDGESTVVQNGATIYRLTCADKPIGKNLMLFANSRYGYVAYTSAARCYGLKLWLDDELVRDFRPCVKGGKPGLYDEVRNEVLFPLGDMEITSVGATANEDGSPIALPWVQTTGSQYVDLGVIGRSGTKIEMEFLLPHANDNGDHGIIGARGSAGTESRFYPIHTHQNCGRIGYVSFKYLNDPLADNVKHHVVSDLRAGSQVLTVDGTEVYRGTDATALDTGRNLYLGAVNFGGTPGYIWPVRVYSLKIWQTATTDANDTDYVLVRDFTPARSWDGNSTDVGKLYDRVSGTFFSPKDTNTKSPDERFRVMDNNPLTVAGAPDALVEYVESDGCQMIHTGVAVEAGLRTEGEVMWTGYYGLEQTHIGSTWWPNRFYPVHSVGQKMWFGYTKDFGQYAMNPETGSNFMWGERVRQSYVVDYSDTSRLTAVVDGVTVMDADASACTIEGNAGQLSVFATTADCTFDFLSKSRCYGFRVFRNGVLTHDFRPCVKDGQGGLYDTVTDRVCLSKLAPITGGLIGPITNSAAMTVSRYVEYVESDGNAWLDTGVIGRSGTKVQIEFTPRWVPNAGDDWSKLDMGLIGSRTSDSGDTRFYPAHSYGGNASYGYGFFSSTSVPLTDGAKHTIESEFRSGCQRVAVDGEEADSTTRTDVIDTGLTMYLGAVNVAGAAQFCSPVRIHRVKIWQTATTDAKDTEYRLVRDYEPAVTANGIIGLWEGVTGKFEVPSSPYVASGKPLPRGMWLIVR